MSHDRPSLRGRYATVDARLRSPGATRTIAALVGGLLLVQGAVVLDRTGTGPDTPEIAALEFDEPPATGPAEPTDPAVVPSTGADGPSPTGATAAAAPLEAAGDASTPTAAAPPSAPSADATTSTGAARGSAAAPAGGTAAPADPARERFGSRFPAQARAGQSTAEPATTRWAVLIGVNEHSGRTRDNLASRQDAEDLARHLRSLGWRDDHIVLLTDGAATREAIIESFRWLQRKADRDSVVVVHYSGHTKQWHGVDKDGDGEITDEALWPSDNRFITDREVGELLGRVRAGSLWFNVGACEAAGFNDWGITGPGRIATYSSGEHQKSYEDPSRGNSVWGYYLIEEGLLGGHADANGDGNVTVEEAFRYATPRAHSRTRGQSHGRQTPEVSDRYSGEFDLRIPPPPRPPSEPSPKPDGGSCLLCPRTGGSSLHRR